MERLKTLSLFSGCGGMDLGVLGGFDYLEREYPKLPTEIVYAMDIDPYAANIYNDNFQHQCNVEDIKTICEKSLPEHDLLIGGFPCQSFSIIAQNPPRLGIKDERGELFFEICRILKEKQPRFFIAENVKGILSANNKQAFPLIIKNFEDSGYYVKYKLLNASEFGIPQKRERVFIVGFRDIEDYHAFNFPEEITVEKKVSLEVTLEKNVDCKYYFSDRAVKGMREAKKHMNKGRAQDAKQPCNTISAHLSKVSLNSTDPVLLENGRYRRFTPREAARIQSFPDNFILKSVSEGRQYKAIGNAVPPALMWHIAKSLIQIAINKPEIEKLRKEENGLEKAS